MARFGAERLRMVSSLFWVSFPSWDPSQRHNPSNDSVLSTHRVPGADERFTWPRNRLPRLLPLPRGATGVPGGAAVLWASTQHCPPLQNPLRLSCPGQSRVWAQGLGLHLEKRLRHSACGRNRRQVLEAGGWWWAAG